MGDSEQPPLTQQAPPLAGGDNAPGEETTASTPMVMRSPSGGEGDKSAKKLPDAAPTTGTYVDASDASAEKEPLKPNAKEEITVEVGEDAANGKEGSGDQKSPGQLPAKKGCDVRCLVIGILVLAIMITGAAVAILAHRFKTETNFEFAFAGYYGDNMVLQRAPHKAVVWGYAPVLLENTTVLVILQGNGGTDEINREYRTTIRNTASGTTWKVILDEISESSPFTITAALEDDSSTQRRIQITNVLFGDVWICAGQENMQFSVDKLLNGSEEIEAVEVFQKIRLFSLYPTKSSVPGFNIRGIQLPWSPPNKHSLAGTSIPDHQASSHFSAVCWLFGKQLYNRLQYPIGLVSVTYADSLMEQWIPTQAREKCAMAETASSSKLWNGMVHPLLDMSHYGLIWYQGEKDAMDGPRNYDCALVEMISHWQEDLYRRTQGSTDRMLPVGIVQLAPNRESSHLTYGYTDIRWRQTANYGFVPNPLLKKAFMASAIDLPDINSTHANVLPQHKHDITNRLVQGALAIAYRQKDVPFQGPLPTNYSINLQNHRLSLYFDSLSIKVHGSSSDGVGFEVCCSDNQTLFCPSSFIKVSYAPGREWVAATISNNTSNSVTLHWSSCSESQHIVGLRYLWRETPCPVLHACPIYSSHTDLPMAPYIRFGLNDDGLTHQFEHDQVNLI